MTDAVVARPGSASASVRAVHGENDWADLLNFQRRLSDALGVEDEGFVTQRLELLRRRAHQGCAAWFTSHQDGQVIGSCGVLLGHGVARLQQLETTQEHRRAGVATSLVIAAAQWAFAQTNVARLVAVADPKYHAASLFRTLGFRDHDLACGVAPAGTVPAHIS
ncbi:GNAT family N-acetyltransferase [Crossiella sp. S99.2]|uniref:GNAT family N-acetyltransferase n=1 Tax=unclassified Crossiella TaxID=2620835 RepID=UPI0035AB76B1